MLETMEILQSPLYILFVCCKQKQIDYIHLNEFELSPFDAYRSHFQMTSSYNYSTQKRPFYFQLYLKTGL